MSATSPKPVSKSSAKQPAAKRYITLAAWQIRPWQLALAIFGFFLIIVVVGWWFRNFERVEVTTYEMSERARYNPYYAAELLLEQTQRRAQSAHDDKVDNVNHIDHDNIASDNAQNGNAQNDRTQSDKRYVQTLLDSDIKTLLDDLPSLAPANDSAGAKLPSASLQPVLIINSMHSKLAPERFAALQHWVEQGGHLITFTGGSIEKEEFEQAMAPINSAEPTPASNVKLANAKLSNAKLDEAIAALGELDVGNQFLASLGIVAVHQSACQQDCDAEAQQDADMEAALAELETQYGISIDPETGDIQPVANPNDSSAPTTAFKYLVEKLKSGQHFAIVEVPDYRAQGVNLRETTGNGLSTAEATLNPPMLIKQVGAGSVIHYELFNAKYPQAIESPLSNAQAQYLHSKHRAQAIRAYLQAELRRFSPASNHTNKNSTQTKRPSAKLYPKPSKPLVDDANVSELITYLLALDNTILLQLFAPVANVYLDVPVGKGRLSVLTTPRLFSNPNPSTDISTDIYDPSIRGTSKVSQWTPLLELIDTNWYHNLYGMDNAALLLALTQNAGRVWILPNTDIEPLPILLWHQAKVAKVQWVMGLALLWLMLVLCLWLWSLYDRFGKRQHLAQTQASNIMGYFYQVGRYGWSFDQANTLLRLSRQQTRDALYEHLPRLITSDNGLASLSAVMQARASFANTNANKANPNPNPNPNLNLSKANPLAQLSRKELTRLSQALIAHYDNKVMQETSLTQNQEAVLALDVRQVLSAPRLTEALIAPLNQTQSLQTLTKMTQTLWLLNWLLR